MKFFLKIYFAYQVRIRALVHSLWKKTKGMFCGSGTCKGPFPQRSSSGWQSKAFPPCLRPAELSGRCEDRAGSQPLNPCLPPGARADPSSGTSQRVQPPAASPPCSSLVSHRCSSDVAFCIPACVHSHLTQHVCVISYLL